MIEQFVLTLGFNGYQKSVIKLPRSKWEKGIMALSHLDFNSILSFKKKSRAKFFRIIISLLLLTDIQLENVHLS